MPDQLLSATAVANALGCSKASVWRYSAAGTIPAPIKVGCLTRWRASDIELFINQIASDAA